MPKKYFVTILAVMMTLSIAFAAGLDDRQENQPITDISGRFDLSITSPQAAQVDNTAWDKSGSRAVIWDNGMTYAGILTAQQESLPDGVDSEPADDFMFAVDQPINDVHWIGGYWNGPPDDGDFDWIIRFYDDDGSGDSPGTLLASYVYANADVNETLISGYYYSYSVIIPPPAIIFSGGVKYWISIQSQGDTPPQGGWAYHETPDILLHQAVIRSVYFGIPDWTNTDAALGVAADMCFQLTYEEPACQWNPGDDHKMHFPQLPDEAGWDVNATQPMILADDFMCSQTGPITDIHFWGGWKGDIEGQIISFVLSIHEDIPVGSIIDTCYADGDCNGDGMALSVADFNYLLAYLAGTGPAPNPLYKADLNGDCVVDQADATLYSDFFTYGMSVFDPYGGYPVLTCCDGLSDYSRPGETLWEREVTEFNVTQFDPPSLEGWYDPATGEVLWDNQAHYWQYDICFDPEDPDLFIQDSTTIYWLNISAIVEDPQGTQWGWKSTQDHWNDDAVWSYWGELAWIDIWEPALPLSNAFGITMTADGHVDGGFGEDAYGDGWYSYPQYGWENIWFYDHPFDSSRYKHGMIAFDIFPFDPGQPMWIEVAVNWATDLWSIEFPDVGPPMPGVDEDLYIGRQILWSADYWEGSVGPLLYEILDYNPEWVSVDVRGLNFVIPAGVIEHSCRGSLDLAFVITGEPLVEDSGACCYDPTGGGVDAACLYTTQTHCEQILGGVYEGTGVLCTAPEACCLPNGDCIMADPLCCVNELGGTPQGAGSQCTALEACCMPDGSCQMLDPVCCDDQGGVPQGPGSQCTALEACCMPDGSCQMLDPLCCDDQGGTPQGAGSDCAATIACCMPDGTCQTVSRICCDDLGGTPSPFGAPMCLGDLNGDGTDDACLVREDLKWRQAPDLDTTGIDVHASCPGWLGECTVLADDFECTQTGPITEIHVYGSWLNDEFPLGDPSLVSFTLSLHRDIPAGIDQPWSHPGEILWIHTFGVGEFQVRPYGVDLVEGFYEPYDGFYAPIGDFSCWEYIFYLEQESFIQEGTPENPVIYWLDVQAMPEVEAYFGWKTSTDHWNDDAVWSIGQEPIDPLIWIELIYPPGHPWELESIDLAFEIYGNEQICDCIPGDANDDGVVNVGDAVYLIAYVFKGGPPPGPYPICSGDANCDCSVNVGDAVYIINYVFKGGPPPCDCLTWLSICGPPLRK